MPWRTTIGHVGLAGPLEDFGGLAVSPAGCSEGLFPTADFVARGIGRAHDVAVGLTGLELGDEHLWFWVLPAPTDRLPLTKTTELEGSSVVQMM